MADWDKLSGLGDVEDRRGAGGLLLGGGGLGVAGIAIVLLFNVLTGGNVDVGNALNQLQGVTATQQTEGSGQFAGEDDYERFARAVLGSSNDMWRQVFARSGQQYDPPKLVLFRGFTQSACGGANSQVGPHYCPADGTIYLDETFFDELTSRLGASQNASGDVAQAYVIAHEVGHHVQHQLGTTDRLGESNEVSIQIELQADCFAGVWAHSVSQQGVFGEGEIREALDAAAAVGDDRIQRQVQGRVNPESWTHGSSEQRVRWFTAGFDTGRPAACNTLGRV